MFLDLPPAIPASPRPYFSLRPRPPAEGPVFFSLSVCVGVVTAGEISPKYPSLQGSTGDQKKQNKMTKLETVIEEATAKELRSSGSCGGTRQPR